MKSDINPRHGRRQFLAEAGLITLASAIPAFAEQPARGRQEPSADWKAQADTVVMKMMQDDNIPGVVIGVVRNGKVAYRKGYGVKHLADGATPDAETVFYIGSLSKALTAVGAMLLVQDGKLDLARPASRYIPDLPATWRSITVLQLMTHTSGIPDVPKRDKNAQADIGGVYRIMADVPMQFAPGTKESYNNFNFAVTGNLIERISGAAYIDFMKRRVFEPLGMDHTGVGRIGLDNHATGYAHSNNGKLSEAEPDIPAFGVPSGGLETNLNDLLKLEASLRTHTLLKPPALTQMITPVKGFDATPGWFARHAAGVTAISKNGAAGGFSSFFSFVPERGDAIIMLRNWQGKGGGIQGPSNSILQACCGIPKHGGSATDE